MPPDVLAETDTLGGGEERKQRQELAGDCQPQKQVLMQIRTAFPYYLMCGRGMCHTSQKSACSISVENIDTLLPFSDSA